MNTIKNNTIDDRKGWLTDSFTLRSILTKVGYQRNNIEDGACFYSYYKYFSDNQFYINIEFSGSYVPEKNIPVVLYHVSFSQKQDWHYHTIELSKVPRVLLAEGYADYMAVAKVCSGFDPEWEKKGI
ncbi:hypothetical protein [Gilliamella sp. ESL0250]|uniref:hypothetical protein n=1 Tax=Gilliamella sp. ESL0250 TaxID=2705036 RepID=UPI0015810606|nr:hypothetical protein [Gilliamella sp. ESL0250]NUF49784.1 hypothetical protein [Gilliamella sp. ESL0250]